MNDVQVKNNSPTFHVVLKEKITRESGATPIISKHSLILVMLNLYNQICLTCVECLLICCVCLIKYFSSQTASRQGYYYSFHLLVLEICLGKWSHYLILLDPLEKCRWGTRYQNTKNDIATKWVFRAVVIARSKILIFFQLNSFTSGL